MLVSLMNEEAYVPMKLKELAILLNVPKEQREELKQVLNLLLAEGKISVSKKGKFGKAEAFALVGVFSGNARGFGFVAIEGQEEDVFIPADRTGGALHGDRVQIVIDSEGRGGRPEGTVVRILEHANETLVGTYEKGKGYGFVIPDNQRISKDIFIPQGCSQGAVSGHKVMVKIRDFGEKKGKKPEGVITEILGHIHDPGVDILSIVRAYNLPEDFPGAVKNQLKQVPDEVKKDSWAGRKDLRDLPTVTIDGEEAKDLDDAISIERAGDGYRLGVHIADVSHYVQEHTPLDEEAFKRIINYPARGIGDTTVNKITAAATSHNVSLWTVLCEPLTYGVNINKGTAGKLQDFRCLIAGFIESVAEKNAYELGTEIIRQSGIIADVCQDNSPENLSRKENIEELANGMSDFCAQRLEEGNANTTLSDFLSEVSLLTDQDSDKDGDDEKITLMTVHSAKGLEFKNVFVVGMEENLFPSGMAGDSPRALEEERRLFYVAITRAEDHCFLTYAKSRYRYGKMEFGNPSRFLKDIDVRFLKLPQDAGLVRKVDEHAASFRRENRENFVSAMYGKRDGGARPRQEIIAPTVPRNLKRVTPSMGTASAASHSSAAAGGNAVLPGQFIEHERFGLGEVLKVEGEGDNAKATIRFKNAGDKQLLLRFARFKVIG